MAFVAWGETWFILVLWLALIFLTWFKGRNSPMLTGATSLIGIFFGLTLLSDVNWLGFIMVVLNLYILYMAVFMREKKKK